MRTQRRFSKEFKRQVVEELLSGVSTAAQLARRHEISTGLLHHWKAQYAKGRFNNPPNKEAVLEERVRQLEQLVGKLTLENEFLKKLYREASHQRRKGHVHYCPSASLPKHRKGV